MAFILAGLTELIGTIASWVLPEATVAVLAGEELSPLLAGQAVQSVLPFVPEATATAIGTSEVAGITGAEIAIAGSLASSAYNLQQAIGQPIVHSEFERLNRVDEIDPNKIREKRFIERTGGRIDTLSDKLKKRDYNPILPTGINPQTISNINVPTNNIFNQGITKLSNTVKDYNIKNKGEELTVDKNGKIRSPWQTGYDLGRFLGLTEDELYKGRGEDVAMRNVSRTFPELAYLLMNVTKFGKYAPKPDTLNKVNRYRSIYTGKNISPENTFIDENGNVGGIDEFGNRHVYTGVRGTLPAYDTFCGPQSPNDKRPTTIFGTICMLHDIGYDKNGYFDLESDLIFASRILNLYPKMGFQERVLALTAVHYFLTVGNSLAMFKDVLPSNVDKVPTNIPANDISKEIYGLQLNPIERQRFYKGLRDGADSTLKLQTAPTKYNTVSLLPMFDQIEVLEVFDMVEEEQEPPTKPPETVPITQPNLETIIDEITQPIDIPQDDVEQVSVVPPVDDAIIETPLVAVS